MRTATGTSLAIIACNSAAGFLSHLGEAPVPWLLAAVFRHHRRCPACWWEEKSFHVCPKPPLRRAFALLVLATATFVLWRR